MPTVRDVDSVDPKDTTYPVPKFIISSADENGLPGVQQPKQNEASNNIKSQPHIPDQTNQINHSNQSNEDQYGSDFQYVVDSESKSQKAQQSQQGLEKTHGEEQPDPSQDLEKELQDSRMNHKDLLNSIYPLNGYIFTGKDILGKGNTKHDSLVEKNGTAPGVNSTDKVTPDVNNKVTSSPKVNRVTTDSIGFHPNALHGSYSSHDSHDSNGSHDSNVSGYSIDEDTELPSQPVTAGPVTLQMDTRDLHFKNQVPHRLPLAASKSDSRIPTVRTLGKSPKTDKEAPTGLLPSFDTPVRPDVATPLVSRNSSGTNLLTHSMLTGSTPNVAATNNIFMRKRTLGLSESHNPKTPIRVSGVSGALSSFQAQQRTMLTSPVKLFPTLKTSPVYELTTPTYNSAPQSALHSHSNSAVNLSSKTDNKRLVDQFFSALNDQPANRSASGDGPTQTKATTPQTEKRGFHFGNDEDDSYDEDHHKVSNELTDEEFNQIVKLGGFTYKVSDNLANDNELISYALNIDTITEDMQNAHKDNGMHLLQSMMDTLTTSIKPAEFGAAQETGSLCELDSLSRYLDTVNTQTKELREKLTNDRETIKVKYRTEISDNLAQLNGLLKELNILETRLKQTRRNITKDKSIMSKDIIDKLDLLEYIDTKFREHSKTVKNRRFKQANIALAVFVVVVSVFFVFR